MSIANKKHILNYGIKTYLVDDRELNILKKRGYKTRICKACNKEYTYLPKRLHHNDDGACNKCYYKWLYSGPSPIEFKKWCKKNMGI